jgi:hypothetical protein
MRSLARAAPGSLRRQVEHRYERCDARDIANGDGPRAARVRAMDGPNNSRRCLHGAKATPTGGLFCIGEGDVLRSLARAVTSAMHPQTPQPMQQIVDQR